MRNIMETKRLSVWNPIANAFRSVFQFNILPTGFNLCVAVLDIGKNQHQNLFLMDGQKLVHYLHIEKRTNAVLTPRLILT